MQEIAFFIDEHIILVSIWLFFLIVLIILVIKNIFIKSKIINNFQVIKLINQDNAIVIDTRNLNDFKKGHIVNSINIPLKNVFLGQFQVIEKYKSYPVILILNDTYRQNKCIKEFLKYGFNHIYIFQNGIYYWNLHHLPLVTKD